jgi:hypothetical protein
MSSEQRFQINVIAVGEAIVSAMKEPNWSSLHKWKDYELPAWLNIFNNVAKIKDSPKYDSSFECNCKFTDKTELCVIWEAYRWWETGKTKISDRGLVIRDHDGQFWGFHHVPSVFDATDAVAVSFDDNKDDRLHDGFVCVKLTEDQLKLYMIVRTRCVF